MSWSGFPRTGTAGGCEAQAWDWAEWGNGEGRAQGRKSHAQSRPESSLSRAVVFEVENMACFRATRCFIHVISCSPVWFYNSAGLERGSHLLLVLYPSPAGRGGMWIPGEGLDPRSSGGTQRVFQHGDRGAEVGV